MGIVYDCPTSKKSLWANGWKWLSWQETVDTFHGWVQTLERRDAWRMRGIEQVKDTMKCLQEELLLHKSNVDDPDLRRISEQLEKEILSVSEAGIFDSSLQLPPSMLAKMAEKTLVADGFMGDPSGEILLSHVKANPDDIEGEGDQAINKGGPWWNVFCHCGQQGGSKIP